MMVEGTMVFPKPHIVVIRQLISEANLTIYDTFMVTNSMLSALEFSPYLLSIHPI